MKEITNDRFVGCINGCLAIVGMALSISTIFCILIAAIMVISMVNTPPEKRSASKPAMCIVGGLGLALFITTTAFWVVIAFRKLRVYKQVSGDIPP